jgi:hypothetical protein
MKRDRVIMPLGFIADLLTLRVSLAKQETETFSISSTPIGFQQECFREAQKRSVRRGCFFEKNFIDFGASFWLLSMLPRAF